MKYIFIKGAEVSFDLKLNWDNDEGSLDVL